MPVRARLSLGLLAAACAPLAFARPAAANVLVNAPGSSVACSTGIRVGVWYRDFPQSSRAASITIKNVHGATVWSRHVTAPASDWRFWTYHGTCGHTYRVGYVSDGDTVSFTVHIRPRGHTKTA